MIVGLVSWLTGGVPVWRRGGGQALTVPVTRRVRQSRPEAAGRLILPDSRRDATESAVDLAARKPLH